MLEIGSVKIKSRLLLAPMAGISDLPFRMLNRDFGCEMAFVEMINARSVSHKSRKTKHMLSSLAGDRALGIQLLGCEPSYILKAIAVLNDYDFEILDFNAACPAKKVVRRGEGAGLLKDPKKFHALLSLIVKHSKRPVTAKIRSGWDENSINAREMALLAEDAGASALFIHGRTKMQEYSGKVNYAVIREVKKALRIPVIANGDALSPVLIKKLFHETGCDAVAIARGSLGNPWIFQSALEYLKHGKLPAPPEIDEVARVMALHLNATVDFYGERVGVVKFRKFFGWYTKGFFRVRELREHSSAAKTQKKMLELIEEARLMGLKRKRRED